MNWQQFFYYSTIFQSNNSNTDMEIKIMNFQNNSILLIKFRNDISIVKNVAHSYFFNQNYEDNHHLYFYFLIIKFVCIIS